MSRGGARTGSGRKPSEEKKQVKSFTLSLEAIEALKNLEVVWKMDSQSAVIEKLVTEAWMNHPSR